jgi:hypothetical protein
MHVAAFLTHLSIAEDSEWMQMFLVTTVADGQGVHWLHVAQPLDRWLEEQRHVQQQQQQPKRSKPSHGCVLDLSG